MKKQGSKRRGQGRDRGQTKGLAEWMGIPHILKGYGEM